MKIKGIVLNLLVLGILLPRVTLAQGFDNSSITPTDNKYAQDADMNGTFDVLKAKTNANYFSLHTSRSNDPFLGIEPGDVRSGLEFDISKYHVGSTIISATFSIYNIGFFHNSNENPQVSQGQNLYGFAGNGSVSLSDFSTTNFLTSTTGTDFDVTGFVQALVDLDSDYAGFVLSQITLGSGSEHYSKDSVELGGPAPKLVILANVVPEPGTYAYLLVALAGFGVMRGRLGNRRRNHPVR